MKAKRRIPKRKGTIQRKTSSSLLRLKQQLKDKSK